MTMNKKNVQVTSEAGFTLVELSVVIVVLGVLLSGALISISQYIKGEKVELTQQNLALVQNSLSAYAQAHYRLPCPSIPQATGDLGTEVDAANCAKTNDTNANLYWEAEGVLPWKELGIPQSVAIDAWHNYITYKPAPQLTVNNLSTDEQDAANVAPGNIQTTLDVHNACRTAMWYDPSANHLNRAKALFCCNSAPTTSYMSHNSFAVTTGMPANWRENGIVDTQTAEGITGTGNNLPDGKPVAMTNNWMDQGDHSDSTLHGPFVGFNSSHPEPPLMRATGLAVTLISHGANGNLAFLAEQSKTSLAGGSVNPTTGTVTSSGTATLEADNIWPPQIFSAVFGHPKRTDHSYDTLNSSSTSSDDVVAYMRSDDLFGRVGQGSCERPPGAAFQPEVPCSPIPINMTNQSFFDPKTNTLTKMQAIDMARNTDEGIPYVLQSNATRLTDDAGYNNSLGYYAIGADGTIESVSMMQQNMHNLAIGQQSIGTTSLQSDSTSVGVFILPDGYDVNGGYANLDMTNVKMVTNFTAGSGSNPDTYTVANVNNANTQATVLVAYNTATGHYQPIYGANSGGNGIFNMYSNLNYGDIDHGWRPDNIAAKSVLKNGGPNADGVSMNIGFEDLDSVNGYYTNDNSLVSGKPPSGNCAKCAKTDQYGGYEANIGDNDYDDVAVDMTMTQCPQQN